MSTAMLTLGNSSGDTVQLPEEIAKTLFGRLKEVESVLCSVGNDDKHDVEDVGEGKEADSVQVAKDGEVPGVAGQDEELRLDNLHCTKEVLVVVRDYALRPDTERTTSIPKPLDRSLQMVVRPDEMAMMHDAEKGKYLTQLLEVALLLKFEGLVALCAAYAYERIEVIARSANGIMAGAEDIRAFLNIRNEWTDVEMEHLQKEMMFAKQVDPNVY